MEYPHLGSWAYVCAMFSVCHAFKLLNHLLELDKTLFGKPL